MTGIFISYRQDDSKPWALLLREELVQAFGETHVFLDKETLHAGSWREQIKEALDRCRVVLVVMGQRWLSVADERGARRLDNPEDVHRQEIAYALSREDITVIPVRVDGAPMPRPAQLPSELRRLTEQQARDLSDRSAHRAVDLKLLIEDIERATGLAANRASTNRHTDAPAPAMKMPAAEAHLGISIRTSLIVAAMASITLLVLANLSGWSLDAQEKSFIVFVVLCLTLGVRWLWNRRGGKNK